MWIWAKILVSFIVTAWFLYVRYGVLFMEASKVKRDKRTTSLELAALAVLMLLIAGLIWFQQMHPKYK